MKIYDLSNGFVPHLKCGPAAIPLAVIGGISALGSSVAGNMIAAQGASDTNQQTMGFNREMQKDAQKFNKDMYATQVADARQNFQMENVEYDRRVRQQQQLQQEMMKYVFEKYSSPSAQAKALSAAGLNPAVLYANGQSPFGGMPSGDIGSVGTGSIAAPSAPTSPTASVSGLQNPSAYFANGLNDVTSAIANIASSSLDLQKKDEISATLQERVNQLVLQNKGIEISNDYLNLQKQIYASYASKEKAAQISAMVSQCFVNYANGNLADAQKGYYELMQEFQRTQNGILQEQKPALIASAFLNLNKINADITASLSTAALASAQSKTENAVRDSIVDFKKSESKLKYLDYLTASKMFISNLDKLEDAIKTDVQLNFEKRQEALLRIQRTKALMQGRDKYQMFEDVDNCLTYLTSQLGIALGSLLK